MKLKNGLRLGQIQKGNLVGVYIGIIALMIIFIAIFLQSGRYTQCWNYGLDKENYIFCAAYANTNFGNGGLFYYIPGKLDWRYEYDCRVFDGWDVVIYCINARKVT